MVKLDTTGWKILSELDRDCRQPHQQIARKLNVSKDVIHYRTKQLEKEGIIQYYYTIINNNKLGLTNYRIYIKLTRTDLEKEQEIIDHLRNHPHITFLMLPSPYYNVGIMLSEHNEGRAYDILHDIKKKYKPYIQEIEVATFTKVYHFTKKHLTGQPSSTTYYLDVHQPEETVTETEQELLKRIANNARIHIIQLARELGINHKTAQSHLKRLERTGIIQGYRAMIDISKLGYTYYKIDLELETMDDYPKLLEYCKGHLNTTYINETIGGKDFEFEVEVKSQHQLNRIIKEVKSLVVVKQLWIHVFGDYYQKLRYR